MTVDKWQISAFLFGLLWAWKIELIGVIYLAEILAIVALPLLILQRSLFSERAIQATTAAYMAILFGLIIADIFNETQSRDYLRGWATPLVGYASLIFGVWLFTRSLKSIYGLLSGLMLAKFASSEISLQLETYEENLNYFKANVAPGFFILIAMVSAIISRYSRKFALVVLAVSAVSFVLLGARSAGLILLISAILLAVRKRLLSENFLAKAMTCLLLLVFFQFLYMVYVNSVLANPDNSNSFSQLSRLANPYNPVNLIFAGRTDVVVAFIAVQQQPLIGLGSWAGDQSGRYSELFFDLNDANVTKYWSYIRSHSILMTAWLWGGVIGLFGATLLAWTFLKCFLQVLRIKEDTVVLAIIFGIDFIWNFLFSPFGHIRTSVPFALAIVLAHMYGPLGRQSERRSNDHVRQRKALE